MTTEHDCGKGDWCPEFGRLALASSRAAAMTTPALLEAIRTERDLDIVAEYRAAWDFRRSRHPNRCAAHMDEPADTCPCYAAAFRIDAQVATGDYSAYRTAPDEPDDHVWPLIQSDEWDADAAHERWLETRYEDEP